MFDEPIPVVNDGGFSFVVRQIIYFIYFISFLFSSLHRAVNTRVVEFIYGLITKKPPKHMD